MPFEWMCPCGNKNLYNGNMTIDAVTNCSSCGYKYRVWKYKINGENIPEMVINKREYNNKLYFIKNRDYVKIGYTRSIENRLTQLQSSNPDKLELIFFMDDAKDLETPLHEYYNKHNKHHRGEWFIFDEFTERIINILRVLKKQKNKLDKIKNRIIRGLE